MSEKILNLKKLADGTDRVCIHWLIPDPVGLVVQEGNIHPPTFAGAAQGQRRQGNFPGRVQAGTKYDQPAGAERRTIHVPYDERTAGGNVSEVLVVGGSVGPR